MCILHMLIARDVAHLPHHALHFYLTELKVRGLVVASHAACAWGAVHSTYMPSHISSVQGAS